MFSPSIVEEQVDGTVDTAPMSWPATAPFIVWRLAEGFWQAGKME